MKKLIILLIGAITSTGALGGINSYNGVINAKSPCTGENITVHGIITISINETVKGVFVSESFTGVEHGYSVNYSGNSTFEEVKKIYPVAVNGEWKSSRENFKSKSLDLIFTKNGIMPTGDKFQKLENECD
jgi:hypothetical protein